MPAERILKIRGGHNFRDMGGYRTADGRTVRWATLYRSGVMSKIDPSEIATLKSLGIVSICDLRTTRERARRPTTWHEGSQVEMLTRDYEMSVGVLKNLIAEGKGSAEAVAEHMHVIYRDLLEEQAESYTALFRRLAEGRTPLVFNCAAGKDRTGIAAALILSALGVSREDVMADYALTNQFVDGLLDLMRQDEDFSGWFGEQPDSAYPLLRAEPIYLDGMFEELEQRYGGLQPYLADILRISEAEVEAMRNHLLE